MGWILFAIIWLLSPIVLLPLSIHKSRKADKLEGFINTLHATKRISDKERYELKVDYNYSGKSSDKKEEDRYVQQSPQPKRAIRPSWICECGYSNRPEIMFCSNCGKHKPGVTTVNAGQDIRGNTADNVKPAPETHNTTPNNSAALSKQPASAAESTRNPYAPVDSASSHSNMGDTIKTVQDTNLTSTQAAKTERASEENWACPSCGKINKPIAVFCANCGEKKAEHAAYTSTENKAEKPTLNPVEQKIASAVNISEEKKYFEPKEEAKNSGTNSAFDTPVFKDSEKPQAVKPAVQPKFISPKKEKRHYDSSTILFGIGVVFVILAGIIFSTAFWVKWSDITRTGVIALASAFFFAISWLSKKKFKLESTSGAMYVTGSVFTAITVFTAGLLKIFGESFSLQGEMKWLFYMCAVLILGLCSFSAEKIYKKPQCRYLTLTSFAVGLTFLTAQFSAFTNEPQKVFAFLTAIIGAVGSCMYVRCIGKEKEISKPVNYTFLFFRGLYLLAGAEVLLIELFSFNGFTLWGWGVCLISIFESFIWLFGYEKMKYPISLTVESVLVAIAAYQLRYEFNDRSVYIFVITGFAIIATAVYNYLEAKGRTIVDAKFEKLALRVIFALYTLPWLGTNFTQWGAAEWVLCSVWAAEMLIYGVIKRSQIHLLLQCLFIEAGILEVLIGKYFPAENTALAIVIFSLAAGAAYKIIKAKGKALFNADDIYLVMRVMLTATVIPVIVKYPSVPLTAIGWIIAGIFLAETLVYAIAEHSKNSLLLHGITLVFMLIKVREAGWLGEFFTLSVTLFAALAYAVYYVLSKKKKLLFNADVVVYLVRIALGLFAAQELGAHLFDWNELHWLVFGILFTELTVYAIESKSQRILALQSIFVVAGNLQFIDKTEGIRFIFFSWLFVAVFTVIYVLLRQNGKLRFNADMVVVGMRTVYAFLLLPFFMLMNVNVFDVWQLGVLLVILAELLIYAIVYKSNRVLALHGAVMFIILFNIRSADWLGDYFTLSVCIFAAIGYAVYYILKKKDMLRFNADKTVYGIRCALGLFTVFELAPNFLGWNALHWIVFALMLTELTVYAILERSEKILAVQCLFIIAGNMTLYSDTHVCMFVFFSWLFIAVGTFVYIQLKRQNKLLFTSDMTLVCMRVAYAFLALLMVEYLLNNDINGWALGASLLITAELGYYGSVFKNRYMLFANSISAVISLAAACLMLETYVPQIDVSTAQFIFSVGLTVLILLYRYFKALSTKATDLFLLAVLFANSCYLLNTACIPYGVISMMAFEAFMVFMAFSDKHFLAKYVRLLLSLPVLITCDFLCIYIGRSLEEWTNYSSHESLIFAGAALMLGVVAFAVGFGIKQDEKKYQPMKYSFEVFSALSIGTSLFWLPTYARDNSMMHFIGCGIAIAASVLLYAVTQTDRNNILSIVPLGELYYAVYKTFSISTYGTQELGNYTLPVSIAMLAVLVIVSRSRSSQSLKIVNEDGKKIYDTAAFGAIFGLPLCIESTWFNHRAALFIMLLECAAFIVNLHRTNNAPKTNRIILTLAAATAGLALVERPFMVFDHTIWMSKIIISIIVLFGVAIRYIWRDETRFASESSKAVFMVAYVLLLVDALMNQTVANSIIVLCASLALLLFSFMKRSKRWFLISAAGLAGLTLYTTKDFFASLAWWLYLLIAGILLITIASVNEYLKGKGKNLKDVTNSYLDTWKW